MLKKSITAILVLAGAFLMQTASASAQQDQQQPAAARQVTYIGLTFKEYLPSQKSGSISVSQFLDALQSGAAGGGKRKPGWI